MIGGRPADPIPRLVAISAGDHGRGRDLGRWLRTLGRAGLPAVLVREPDLDEATLKEVVQVALDEVPVVWVHARCAATFGLPVHVAATGAAPDGVPWGRSCHLGSEVEDALATGASWAFLSPVWRPTSKPGDVRPPLGLEPFLSVARGRPVLALGGVTVERFVRLREAGAHGAAVLGMLLGAPSLGIATACLSRLRPAC